MRQGGNFENLCLSLNPQRNESHIKVSKYCQFVTVVPVYNYTTVKTPPRFSITAKCESGEATIAVRP